LLDTPQHWLTDRQRPVNMTWPDAYDERPAFGTER